MEVSGLKSAGGSLVVVGTIMGAMPAEAILTPSELRKSFKLLSVGIMLLIIRMLLGK